MSKTANPISVEIKGNLAWVTVDSPPVNATSTAVRAGLLTAVEQVQGCDLAVLLCAGKTFIAGGDMSEFDAPPVEPHLPDVADAIEGSATPFVAVMHGTVLGGGFEIAMACAHRIAKPGTRFGLPEVNVGLIPGAGGTQRAPRLLGWDAAVDMACLGKMKSAEDLLPLGGIDLISDMPEAEVGRFIGKPVNPVSKRTAPETLSLKDTELNVRNFANGRTAPLHNLTALQWALTPYAEGQPKERALHLKLRQSSESIALRHVFFAERSVAKPALLKRASPRDVNAVAIVGGGLMGCGIAAACLNARLQVTVIEQNVEAAKKARVTVSSLLQGAVERGKITETDRDTRLAALTTTNQFSDARNADLAVEAVFEDLEAKRTVFTQLAKVMRPDAILATNTSYLNPDEIFAGTPNLDRCLGIHFFSPAHIMKLVEVVKASSTSPAALATSFALAKSLRKTPVLSGICDGFIGNRILAAYRRAAEYLLADGAFPHEVDAAMRNFGMAMGPFEAQDQSGLQIAEANRRRLDVTRDPNERYIPIADRICALGRYGRRSCAGWYRYEEGDRTPYRDGTIDDLIQTFAKEAGITRQSFSESEIQAQLLTAMANEGAQIVDEAIAETAAAVDVVKTAGYGFPRWRGGPMHWAETVGEAAIRNTLDRMEKASPGSWTRAARYR